MIYTAIISIFLVLMAFYALRYYGVRFAAVSPPVLMNLFIMGYTVIGVHLYYGGVYYFLGSDFESYLNYLYFVINIFNVIFVAVFLLSVKIWKAPRRTQVEHKITSSFLVIYASPLFAYAALRLSLLSELTNPLLNVLMILFNSLIPIIGYALLRSVKFSRYFLVGFILLAVVFGFRYRIILLLLPIVLYYFILHIKKLKSKIALSASILFGVLLIAVVGVTREYSAGLEFSKLEGLSIGDILIHGIFNDTSTVLVSGAVIDQIRVGGNYAGFDQIYYILAYFVPSSILENKEYSPIFSYVAQVTGQYSNESGAAVLGFVEYYHTAGYVGVLIFATGIAVVLSRLYKAAAYGNGYDIFFYLVIATWFINSLTRGYFPQNFQDLISLYLGLRIIRMKISSTSVYIFSPRRTV